MTIAAASATATAGQNSLILLGLLGLMAYLFWLTIKAYMQNKVLASIVAAFFFLALLHTFIAAFYSPTPNANLSTEEQAIVMLANQQRVPYNNLRLDVMQTSTIAFDATMERLANKTGVPKEKLLEAYNDRGRWYVVWIPDRSEKSAETSKPEASTKER